MSDRPAPIRDAAGTGGPGRPGGAPARSPWLVFPVLAFVEFMVVMDASVVNIALPTIGDDLGFSTAALAWVVDGYLLGFAGFLLIAGRAADLLGRRRMFLSGVAVFTLASLACALSTQDWHLVASRVLQGFGAALVVPATLALITDIFPEGPQRNKALGVFSGMAGVAAPIGLVLGGVLASVAWEWIFLINVPLCTGVWLVALRLLPVTPRRPLGDTDVLSAAVFTAGLCLLIFATIRGGAQGWGSAATVLEYAAAGVLLALFVLRQRAATHPMVPRVLVRSRSLMVGNSVFVVVGTLLFGTFFIVTLYLQRVQEYGSMRAGLAFAPLPLAMLLGTQLVPRLLRHGPRNVLMCALLIQAGALTGWALVMSEDGGYLLGFLLPACVWAFGLGMSIVSSFVVCSQGVTGTVAGAASGLATTTYQAGGALGLAALTAVADSRTHGLLTDGSGTGYHQAQVDGYVLALWVGITLAVLGAALTRLIRPVPTPLVQDAPVPAVQNVPTPPAGAHPGGRPDAAPGRAPAREPRAEAVDRS